MDTIFHQMCELAATSTHIIFIDKNTLAFDQTARDALVEAYYKENPSFIDDALQSSLTLLERGDEAIRASRVNEFNNDLDGLVVEAEASLGRRISRQIDNYAVFLYTADYGDKFDAEVKRLKEQSKTA